MTSKIVSWVIPNEADNTPGSKYLNLKAHKPQANYPGRVITTGCGNFVENLSTLTAYELKKSHIEYRVIDTPHFLRKLDVLNNSCILFGKSIIHVNIDIISMFTNIPRDMGLEQCKKFLDMRENPQFSTECIIDGLIITLDYNISYFNNVLYRQCKGAAMGSKNSCEYADHATL